MKHLCPQNILVLWQKQISPRKHPRFWQTWKAHTDWESKQCISLELTREKMWWAFMFLALGEIDLDISWWSLWCQALSEVYTSSFPANRTPKSEANLINQYCLLEQLRMWGPNYMVKLNSSENLLEWNIHPSHVQAAIFKHVGTSSTKSQPMELVFQQTDLGTSCMFSTSILK